MSSMLPHEIRLIAAVSRLIDLHQSRRETGVYVPETQERGGVFLSIALLVLDILRDLEMERGPGFVAVTDLLARIRGRVFALSEEDLEFVIDSLASEREIRYGMENGSGGLIYGLTKDTTPLLEKARGFAQVQLSENGRLLLRVSSMKESWLYSDLDAERLTKAIERDQFDDIPRFCKMMVLEIATKNKQLSTVMERPTFTDLRDMLNQNGTAISQSLRDASEVVKRTCVLIFDDRTHEAFERWKLRSGAAYSLGNLQTEVELVLQNVEALSRRFVNFLETAQRARTTGGFGIPFMSIAESLTSSSSTSDVNRLEAMLAGLMPWGVGDAFFNPLQMVGSVDFSMFEETHADHSVSTFTLEPDAATGHGRFMDFILRNRELVIAKLKTRPSTFLEVITEIGFAMEEGETPADFFGVYTAPEHLNGESFRIVIGITGERFDTSIAGKRYAGTNPMMFLE